MKRKNSFLPKKMIRLTLILFALLLSGYVQAQSQIKSQSTSSCLSLHPEGSLKSWFSGSCNSETKHDAGPDEGPDCS